MFRQINYAAFLLGLFLSVVSSSITSAASIDLDAVKKACVVDSETRMIPNILGLELSVAQSVIEVCDLVWNDKPIGYATSYFAIGKVGFQNPFGGSIVKKGSSVLPSISLGYHLPSFVGYSDTVAKEWLRERGFGFSPKFHHVRNVAPIGQVFDQEPKPNEEYEFGHQVNIFVSKGLYVEVPDFRGARWEIAKREVSSHKLKHMHGSGDTASSSTPIKDCFILVREPIVSDQEPEPGAILFEGDTVVFHTRVLEKKESARVDVDGRPCK